MPAVVETNLTVRDVHPDAAADYMDSDGLRVSVGVQGDEASATHPRRISDARSFTNVEIAVFHELGDASQGIPQRSFLEDTLEDHDTEYVGVVVRAASSGPVGGFKTIMEKTLAGVGAKMVKDIQQYMRDGIEPELRDYTIRRRKGPGPYIPLIDSETLLESITSLVKQGGDE